MHYLRKAVALIPLLLLVLLFDVALIGWLSPTVHDGPEAGDEVTSAEAAVIQWKAETWESIRSWWDS